MLAWFSEMPLSFRPLLLALTVTLITLPLLLTLTHASETEGSTESEQGDEEDKPGLTGDWLGVRTWAGERGITFTTSYTGQVLGNLHGGIHTGATYDALLLMGIDFKLSKLLGWKGATFHASICDPQGSSLTDKYVGDFGVVSNLDTYDSVRLAELWLEQTAWDGHFSTRIGFLAADEEFCVCKTAENFINSSFGIPGGLADNFAVASYPYGGLGVRFIAEPVPRFSIKLGIYDGNVASGVFPDPSPRATPSTEFDHWGTHFALRSSEGAMGLLELEWQHGDADSKAHPAPLTGDFIVGAAYHTDRFGLIEDRTLDDLGSPRETVNSGIRGNYAIYGIAEHELWREPGSQKDGLAAFTRATFTPPGRNFFEYTTETGFVYHGLFQADAADTLGIGVAVLGVSPGVRAAYRSTGVHLATAETSVELTYQYEVTPSLSVQPDFQWILHPGGTGPSALIAGLRVSLKL